MVLNSVISKGYSMYDLLPIIENWLIEHEFHVTTLANRIDATNAIEQVRFFLVNYPSGCLIKVFSSEEFFEIIRTYLAENHYLDHSVECPYCGTKSLLSEGKCTNCHAPFK
jgi:hypothetical protein